MKIPSEDVIQADTPERVMKTIDAIALGAHNDRAIAIAIGRLDARQGRYYRRAAEVLGFTIRDKRLSVPTTAGNEFANASHREKRELFTRAVLSNTLFQRLLPFLESKGVSGATRKDLEEFLAAVAELGARSMVKRRISSYMSWLTRLGLAKMVDDRIVLGRLPPLVPIVQYESDEEPIFPRHYNLKEYKDQAKRTAQNLNSIAYFVDEAKLERAKTSHELLINSMATRLRKHGAVPKANRYIDLSARVNGSDFLFEMKSTTDDNPHSQIRRGLSQLYEYKYIQHATNGKLVLVIENPLPKKLAWMDKYLVNDRGVLLVWDGNGKFTCSPESKSQLDFLI